MKISKILEWLREENYAFEYIGDYDYNVESFSSLSNYQQGSLTWIKKKEYVEKVDIANIDCAVVQKGLYLSVPNQIISSNSKEVFFAILHHFWGTEPKEGFIGNGTVITEDAHIDPTAYIGYNCSIIGPVSIGAHTVIENNVVIQGKVSIGTHCHIQSQAVIGIDGFGASKDPETGKRTMIEHFGSVQIGNNVFIGSHVNIARGTIENTVIADGVKIAPSTHIGHNNSIEENAIIICSLIYGSCQVMKNTYITASTIQNQSVIGEHSVIGMGSVVTKSIPDNVIAFGIPAKVKKENNSEL